MAKKNGYVGLFDVPVNETVIPRLDFTTDGAQLQVVETGGAGRALIGVPTDLMSNGSADITNVLVETGSIRTIIIERKLNTDADVEANWKQHAEVAVDWDTNSSNCDYVGIPLPGIAATSLVGKAHDFRARFLNPDGHPATLTDGTTEAVLRDENVSFNGTNDMKELLEVLDLQVTNATGPESGTLQNGRIAHLTWYDTKKLTPSDYDPINITDGDAHWGDGVAITSGNLPSAGNLSGVLFYDVFLFEPSGANTAPEHPYPNKSDANGQWYYVDSVTGLSCDVKCTAGTKAGFWVGARTNISDPDLFKDTIGDGDIREVHPYKKND